MGGPKKFLCALPIGFVIGMLIFIGTIRYQLGVPTTSSKWISELIERKYRASDKISEPKILLLGGSATLFGVKASVIESELGIPVVNGGMHAGLGMDLILRNGKKMLRQGDTVLLFPEYELLGYGENNRREWASITYLDYLLARDSTYYVGLPLYDQLEIALMTPPDRIWSGIKERSFPEQRMKMTEYNPYDSDCIDFRGDMTGHIASRRPNVAKDRDHRICKIFLEGLSLDKEGFELIADFKLWADGNRINIIAGFPNLVDRTDYVASMVEDLDSQLRKFYMMHDIEVLGSVDESLMPKSYFFDTIYHPTEEASGQISKRVAEQLRPLIPNANKQ